MNFELPIPNFQDLMNPFLRVLHQIGGRATYDEIADKVIEFLVMSGDLVMRPGNYVKSYRSEIYSQLTIAMLYLKDYGIINNTVGDVWAFAEDKQNITSVNTKQVFNFVKNKRYHDKLIRDADPMIKEDNLCEPMIKKDNLNDDFFHDAENMKEDDIPRNETVGVDFFRSNDKKEKAINDNINDDINLPNKITMTDKEKDCIKLIIDYFKENGNYEIKQKYKNTFQIIIVSGDDTIELEFTLDRYHSILNIYHYIEYDPIIAESLLRLFSRPGIISTLSIDSLKSHDYYLINKSIEFLRYETHEIKNLLDRVIMDVCIAHDCIKKR